MALVRVLSSAGRAASPHLSRGIGQLSVPAGPHSRQVAANTESLALVVPLATGLQAAVEDQPMPDVDEALKLAEAAIKAGNYEGYLSRRRPWRRKGQWDAARWKEYVKGLDLLSRGGQARIKPRLCGRAALPDRESPAFKRPTALTRPTRCWARSTLPWDCGCSTLGCCPRPRRNSSRPWPRITIRTRAMVLPGPGAPAAGQADGSRRQLPGRGPAGTAEQTESRGG